MPDICHALRARYVAAAERAIRGALIFALLILMIAATRYMPMAREPRLIDFRYF